MMEKNIQRVAKEKFDFFKQHEFMKRNKTLAHVVFGFVVPLGFCVVIGLGFTQIFNSEYFIRKTALENKISKQHLPSLAQQVDIIKLVSDLRKDTDNTQAIKKLSTYDASVTFITGEPNLNYLYGIIKYKSNLFLHYEMYPHHTDISMPDVSFEDAKILQKNLGKDYTVKVLAVDDDVMLEVTQVRREE